jgi:hypothetical protein
VDHRFTGGGLALLGFSLSGLRLEVQIELTLIEYPGIDIIAVRLIAATSCGPKADKHRYWQNSGFWPRNFVVMPHYRPIAVA